MSTLELCNCLPYRAIQIDIYLLTYFITCAVWDRQLLIPSAASTVAYGRIRNSRPLCQLSDWSITSSFTADKRICRPLQRQQKHVASSTFSESHRVLRMCHGDMRLVILWYYRSWPP